MKYSLSFPNPQNHLIRISIPLTASDQPTVLHLPKWRPGRYEMGPYAENICDVSAVSEGNKALKVTKLATHTWQIEPSTGDFSFQYAYYAVDWGAGGSRFDEHFVYINGVNLLMYQDGQIDQPCEIELDLPEAYQIACGLRREGHTLYADDFHQAVDAPLFASDSLNHHSFPVGNTIHHVWFQGEVNPDWKRIKDHFTRFGEAQIQLFGDLPVPEYHYLFLAPNVANYHGVEHYNSTIISLGPGFKLMTDELYHELLGVSSHELFHTWNVKAIRPADMQPYRYDEENYSKLHYVTEGVTTYYGDLMLLKSEVWDLSQYLNNLNNAVLRRHYQNNGRDHVSLEQSSFDSWLVGYKAGIPNQKISFYTKGCLAAFILDYLIRSSTGNKRSLDHVMRDLYEQFGKTGKGYTRSDYREIAEKHAGVSLGRYFKKIISGTTSLDGTLRDAASYFGLEFRRRIFDLPYEEKYGFFTRTKSGGTFGKVVQIYEGSPAEQAGLIVGDQILAVNHIKSPEKDLKAVFNHFGLDRDQRLHVFRSGRMVELTLPYDADYRTDLYMMQEQKDASESQLQNRAAWMRVELS